MHQLRGTVVPTPNAGERTSTVTMKTLIATIKKPTPKKRREMPSRQRRIKTTTPSPMEMPGPRRTKPRSAR